MNERCEATEQYLDLYQIAVEMADRVPARRATANAFFLTVNTALLAFVSSGSLNVLSLVALAGIALSGTWAVLLKSYRDLNAAKFGVIIEMENNLEAKVFDEEWKRFDCGSEGRGFGPICYQLCTLVSCDLLSVVWFRFALDMAEARPWRMCVGGAACRSWLREGPDDLSRLAGVSLDQARTVLEQAALRLRIPSGG
jgi:hypothetical protein